MEERKKNRDESIDNFKNYLESEVPKLVSQMKNEQEARENAYIMAEHESEQIMASLQSILEPDVELIN